MTNRSRVKLFTGEGENSCSEGWGGKEGCKEGEGLGRQNSRVMGGGRKEVGVCVCVCVLGQAGRQAVNTVRQFG